MIASRAERFISEGLGIAGIAFLDARLAYSIRGDLWSGPLIAAQDFVWNEVKKFVEGLPNVKIYGVKFEGMDEWIPLAARSEDDLARRIEWVTGRHVEGLRPWIHTVAPTTNRQAPEQESLPDYPCARRTEMLAERGERDPKFDSATKFAPKRQGL